MPVDVQNQTISIEQIIQRHQREVWRFLLALGCDFAEAEDLAQETFVAVLRDGFEYRGVSETAAYLRKVAKHRFISSVRKRKRGPVVRNLDDVDVEWARFESECDGDRRIELLRKCLQTLADRARQGLELRYRTGLNRAEIAARLDMKETGVRTLLDRARSALRECVQRKMKTHD